MKKLLLPLLSLLLAAVSCKTAPVEITIVDPLTKILYCDTVFVPFTDTVHVARGENAVFQFVLSSDRNLSSLEASVSDGLGDKVTGWVHDVYNEISAQGADDLIVTEKKLYPDPIYDDQEEGIEAGGHATFWVDIDVPRETEAGLYKEKLTVSFMADGKKYKAAKPFYVKVYPVALPQEQSLKVVNWYSKDNLKYMNGGKPVNEDKETYLQLLRTMASTAAKYGQNCWKLADYPVAGLNADSTNFVLDFANVDEVIETLRQYGNLKYFCNAHIGKRLSDQMWKDAFLFNIIYVKDKQICNESVPYTDPRLKTFINEYFSQLENHYREKGWLGCCYQHIADEPDWTGTESQKSWSAVAAMIKEAAPSLRNIDASSEIVENQDVSVVVLGDNIATMPPVPDGSERWMYTCCVPQGNFANRFVQQPLIKTRILHWLNYKYKECGYLHWGFNYWYVTGDKDPRVDVSPYGRTWPGGDAFIVYPGDKKVYPSIRLGTMRDGIRDYDLLKMVEAKDPAKAAEFVNSVILAPDKYNADTRHFHQLHRQILEYLSE